MLIYIFRGGRAESELPGRRSVTSPAACGALILHTSDENSHSLPHKAIGTERLIVCDSTSTVFYLPSIPKPYELDEAQTHTFTS